jgi:hypothetical protein
MTPGVLTPEHRSQCPQNPQCGSIRSQLTCHRIHIQDPCLRIVIRVIMMKASWLQTGGPPLAGARKWCTIYSHCILRVCNSLPPQLEDASYHGNKRPILHWNKQGDWRDFILVCRIEKTRFLCAFRLSGVHMFANDSTKFVSAFDGALPVDIVICLKSISFVQVLYET